MIILRSILMLAVVVALAACQTTGTATAANTTVNAAPQQFQNASSSVGVPDSAPAMTIGSQARPPIGFVGFCIRNRHDCRPAGDITTSSTGANHTAGASTATGNLMPAVALTPQRWRELNDVNTYFNRTVRPVNDIDNVQKIEWWSYAINSAGDCEDYVLEKRRALIARGWPADALLITVVRQLNGEGHAVLTVVTDKGDLILDNMAMGIVSFDKAPYSWLMRQSRQHPMHWVKLNDSGRGANTPNTASAQATLTNTPNFVVESSSGL